MCEQSLNDYITEQCALIDAALDRLLPAENESPETNPNKNIGAKNMAAPSTLTPAATPMYKAITKNRMNPATRYVTYWTTDIF